MPNELTVTTRALDFFTTAEGTAYGAAMVTYLGIQGTIICNSQALTYNILHTSAILCMTSFAIALSGILIYIIRAFLESYNEYQANTEDSEVFTSRSTCGKAAVISRAVIAPIVLIIGLAFMALASWQNAVGLNALAQNFVQTHLSATFTNLGIGLASLSGVLFLGLIAWHCKCGADKKKTRSFNRISYLLIIGGAVSAIFGASLIAAGQFTEPLNITSQIPINVTLWMTCAFAVVGVGILIRDISQAYLNAHSSRRKEKIFGNDDDDDFTVEEVQKRSEYIDNHRTANTWIPIFTGMGVAFMAASAAMYDSLATINPTTQNVFQVSYGLLAFGIVFFGFSFALKFITDFSRHDIDHGINEKKVNINIIELIEPAVSQI